MVTLEPLVALDTLFCVLYSVGKVKLTVKLVFVTYPPIFLNFFVLWLYPIYHLTLSIWYICTGWYTNVLIRVKYNIISTRRTQHEHQIQYYIIRNPHSPTISILQLQQSHVPQVSIYESVLSNKPRFVSFPAWLLSSGCNSRGCDVWSVFRVSW